MCVCICVYIYIYEIYISMNRYIFVYIHIAPLWLLRAAAAREPNRGNEAFYGQQSRSYIALAYGQSTKLACGQLKVNVLAIRGNL